MALDKESLYLLQCIDTNCNDCKNMVRDFEKMKSFDHLHVGQEKASHRCNYGNCTKFNKPVIFLANTCNPENKECFVHRRN